MCFAALGGGCGCLACGVAVLGVVAYVGLAVSLVVGILACLSFVLLCGLVLSCGVCGFLRWLVVGGVFFGFVFGCMGFGLLLVGVDFEVWVCCLAGA